MNNRQLTWPQRGRLWLRLGLRLILTALAVWTVIRFGRPLLSLFAPFLFALAAAALLNPLVKRLQKVLGWNRQLLSALLLILLFGLIGGGLALLVYAAAGQLMSLVQNWSGLLASAQSAMDQVEALFARFLALVPPQRFSAGNPLPRQYSGLFPTGSPQHSKKLSWRDATGTPSGRKTTSAPLWSEAAWPWPAHSTPMCRRPT